VANFLRTMAPTAISYMLFTEQGPVSVISEPVSGGSVPAPSTSRIVFCSPLFGSDSSGDGTMSNPYATIAKAYSTITTASASEHWQIVLFQGTYSEAVALKPFIELVGWDPTEIAEDTYPAVISGSVTLGAGFSTAGARGWVTDVSVDGTIILNFTTTSSTDGVVSFTNCQLEQDATIIMNAGNTVELHGCTLWGGYDQEGGIGTWFNTAGADVKLLTVRAIAATGATFNMENSSWRGDVEILQNGVVDAGMTINLLNSHAREGSWVVNAAGGFCPNVNAPFGAVPENVTLTGSSAKAMSRQMRISQALNIASGIELNVGVTDIAVPLVDTFFGQTSIEQLACSLTFIGAGWTTLQNAQVLWSWYVRRQAGVNEVHVCLLNTDVITNTPSLDFVLTAYFPSTEGV